MIKKENKLNSKKDERKIKKKKIRKRKEGMNQTSEK